MTKTTETAANKRVEGGIGGNHEKTRESRVQTTGSPNNGFRNTRPNALKTLDLRDLKPHKERKGERKKGGQNSAILCKRVLGHSCVQ